MDGFQQQKHNQQRYQSGLLKFSEILQAFEDKKVYQKALRQASKKYDIKIFKVQNMTPVKSRKIYPLLMKKYKQSLGLSQGWLQNQRRLFLWMVLCYAYVSGKNIQDLNKGDFQIFSLIFNLKEYCFLKYQVFAMKKMTKKWSAQQDRILNKVIQRSQKQTNNNQQNKKHTLESQNTKKIKSQQSLYFAQIKQKQNNSSIQNQTQNQNQNGSNEFQWNQISKQFFYESGNQLYRSSKQCRERYTNHLDTNKIKGNWSSKQDLQLVSSVKQLGKKWSQIVKVLGGCKTQHMIKNRFNSLYNKKSKAMPDKSQSRIIYAIINELTTLEQSIKSQENPQIVLSSSKQSNHFCEGVRSFNSSKSVKSQRLKEEKQRAQQALMFDIFQKEPAKPTKKFRFWVRKVGSLQVGDQRGNRSEFGNQILEQMQSQQQRRNKKCTVQTPSSERGLCLNGIFQTKSPSYMQQQHFLNPNNGNNSFQLNRNTINCQPGASGSIVPGLFFLQQNRKNNIYGSEFSMSCGSNFGKFIPDPPEGDSLMGGRNNSSIMGVVLHSQDDKLKQQQAIKQQYQE